MRGLICSVCLLQGIQEQAIFNVAVNVSGPIRFQLLAVDEQGVLCQTTASHHVTNYIYTHGRSIIYFL